ncbi:MAG: triose-phosphate isomerase, partial [Candidatus Hydrothermota bacterium]
MRRNIIAGNWKMHKTHFEAEEFVAQLLSEVKKIHSSYEV